MRHGSHGLFIRTFLVPSNRGLGFGVSGLKVYDVPLNRGLWSLSQGMQV